jgi:hypothetical protein
MRVIRNLRHRPQTIAALGALALALSFFVTFATRNVAAHGHDMCGYRSITPFVLVPIQLAGFLTLLALLQTAAARWAIVGARIIAGIGLATVYVLAMVGFCEQTGRGLVVGGMALAVAEMLRRAASWTSATPMAVARFAATGASVTVALLLLLRIDEAHVAFGANIALAGSIALAVGSIATMVQLHRQRYLPAVPLATVK